MYKSYAIIWSQCLSGELETFQVFDNFRLTQRFSMGTAFGLGWRLEGLWAGVAIALGLVGIIEGTFLWRTDWERSVEDAKGRNERA